MKEEIKRNYLGAKYTLDNLKKQKIQIIHAKFLHEYGVSLYGRTVTSKIYYDTEDCYFFKVGISISIFRVKNGDSKLIVRFNSNTNRIMFLTDIPDTFEKKIGTHSSIKDNIDFIASAIYDIIPNGISADVKELLKGVKPVISVDKKSEMYRAINANGFKTIMSFSNCVYHNHRNKAKAKLELLEIQSEAEHAKFFPTFTKLITFEFPELIATHSSDLNVGLEFCTK